MDELIIRSLQGAISDLEGKRLTEWRAASATRERHYQDVQRLWALGEVLTQPHDQESVPTIRELEARAGSRPRLADLQRRRFRLPRVFFGLMAAGVAALVVVGGAKLLNERSSPGLGAAEFVTGPGEMVTVTLGDGTIVKLAPESRLLLRGGNGREVWLDGHGYFAVAKQDGQPFRIRTHAGNAVVLGTRFDLQAREGRLRLLVVEGKVELAAGGKTVELEASELGEVVGDAPATEQELDPANVQDQLSWMGDFLAFEATPLDEAVRELTLHYGVPVVVLDSALARETVHGWFANKNLESVLEILCRAVDAHCSILPTGVTIGP